MEYFRKIRWIFICVVMGIILGGCVSGGNGDDGRINVAVSIVPLKTFTEAVCKEKVRVEVMIPPGYSPETYEPSPRDMKLFSETAIYFAIGVQAETNSILPVAGEYDFPVINLHEIVGEAYDDLEIDPGERDPHIWLSPKRVKVIVTAIADELAALDPENGSYYRDNADAFMEELDGVDGEIREILTKVKNRKFIVFHPALGYFADEYGLEMYALEEHGKEATAQRLREMVDFAKEEAIRTVFYQAEISDRQAVSFAREIGGKTVKLDPLSPKYLENLKAMADLMAETMK